MHEKSAGVPIDAAGNAEVRVSLGASTEEKGHPCGHAATSSDSGEALNFVDDVYGRDTAVMAKTAALR